MPVDHRKYDLQKGGSIIEADQSTGKPMHPGVWKLMLLFGVFIYGSYPIFVHLCEKDGRLPFSTTSLIFLTEVAKLCICVCCLMPDILAGRVEFPSLLSSLAFAVPAVLYCFNNNLSLHMQLHMDPATYQVLSNLKILSTALLYRLIMTRSMTAVQWFSLVMLVCAGLSNSYGGFHAMGQLSSSAGVIHISAQGLLMMAIYCFISGFAGVYSEYVLKKRYEISIHLQNGMLYIYGALLNGALWVYNCATSQNPDVSWNLFQGFSTYVWILVLTQSVIGLIMSAIMKHSSNITRLFLISSAMMVTTLFSVVIFHLQLNFYFCVALVLVTLALMLYHGVLDVEQLYTSLRHKYYTLLTKTPTISV